MKKLMILLTCMSLQIFASQDSHWEIDPNCHFREVKAKGVAHSEYFLRTEAGDMIGLNYRGNPVFVASGVRMEQNGKCFVMIESDKIAYEEQLVCGCYGAEKYEELKKALQAKMKQ